MHLSADLAIPQTLSDVTPRWLSEAMQRRITGLEAERIGVGVGIASSLYRVTLTAPDGDAPDTVIVKLPADDEATLFTAAILRMYVREVHFYSELAAGCPVRVPAAYHGNVDADANQFVLVLEDMAALRSVDQLEGMSPADAATAVDALARWHAHWWTAADPIVATGAAIAMTDPLYPVVLPAVFAEGWEKVTSSMPVSPEIEAVGPRWIDALPGMLEQLGSAPTTLCHGDFRADNLMFDLDGSVAVLDFQLIGAATAPYDLAYFVTGSLSPEHASADEKMLFDRWRHALAAHGVPDADTASLWEKYRVAALFCLVYPVVACRGMDLDDDRQRGLIGLMNERLSRAIDELDLLDLLD